MTELPPGWARTTLGELGAYINGRGFKRSEWSRQGRPIIRIQNLTRTNSQFNHFDGEIESRYIVSTGALLVSWAATLDAFIWRGPEAVLNQHIFKVDSKIDERFHYHLIKYLLTKLAETAHGSGMVHVTRSRFESVDVALPPLAEQRRIVEVLEDHLSRLDAAVYGLDKGVKRVEKLRKRIIVSAIPVELPSGWRMITTGEAGKVELGRARHPDWHTGSHMKKYLRVANVFEDRIDETDLMQMNFPPEVFEKYRLLPGDVLLNEGQSPEYLGRPAMYRGSPREVAFTNSLIRFQAGPDVLPEWALLVFRRHMHAGRFLREVRITTNIAHLSATRLKSVEFPVPPIEEQRRITAEVATRLYEVEHFRAALDMARRRSDCLRRSLLTEAFAGRLVPQDPNDEPASVLLDRIKAERAATTKPPRAPRKPKRPASDYTVGVPEKETLF
ncbi:type I restriction enzyme S subunit [Stackebrandtia albiflava]|uniref:Type I restriction enzyme S subunit n=1 Tax=Stackebrandtia albiflava TaxID=406432 RepID=A0A562UL80_9ACTN|nr:restriction endonuclease subunit S [Stackebrandtia albiflava]TWJ06373.1 type I restriction enzyme S subunit [Stackebrandtia albiflava]